MGMAITDKRRLKLGALLAACLTGCAPAHAQQVPPATVAATPADDTAGQSA
jgi:hypothetical protein